jgi:hypothetical protein
MDDTRSPELEVLRREIAELYSRRAQADLSQGSFQKAADAKIVDLFRAIARRQMAEGEDVELEHHVILARTRLDQMVLRDSAQELASVFATQRRLVEVRTVADEDVPPTCDDRDHLAVVELPFRQMFGFSKRRQFRAGQGTVGLVISAIGLIGGLKLGFTGPALVLLGVVGTLHALLFPTRWVEVSGVSAGGKRAAIRIQCIRRQTAKAIISLVRRRMPPVPQAMEETGNAERFGPSAR